jgi:hypothetical protein
MGVGQCGDIGGLVLDNLGVKTLDLTINDYT